MRLLRNSKIVPALMLHSVGLESHSWIWNMLSESVESCEQKLTALKEHGFTTIFWGDLYDYMAGYRPLPRDSILITFDDGYLDNWVLAYPILKRLGMKATIFVTPEFVDPGSSARPTLDDVETGRCGRDELQIAGFLNWPEMRSMESSGLIDIQSHALTHTWYFRSPHIVDFHAPEPRPRHPWLMWNARPDRKPFYLVEDQQSFVPWGHPVFEHEKALLCTRFFPDDGRVGDITGYVAENGGAAFLETPGWRDRLSELLVRLGLGEGFPGRYETEGEREARVRTELVTSKEMLESNLGKVVDFVCWPGGGNDAMVRRAALAAGYKSWTLGTGDPSAKRNLPNTDPTSIRRMNTSNEEWLWGRRVSTRGPRFHLLRVYAHQMSLWHSALAYATKVATFATRSSP